MIKTSREHQHKSEFGEKNQKQCNLGIEINVNRTQERITKKRESNFRNQG